MTIPVKKIILICISTRYFWGRFQT